MATIDEALIEWGSASLPLGVEVQSGDLHLIRMLPNRVLVAAVDGLGHGYEAAMAASLAVAALEAHAQESVISLVNHCHKQLLETRGVVMSLASFTPQDGTMTWLGVGNVEGTLLRADTNARPQKESLLLRPGVVGGQLPLLSDAIVPVMRGDTLIFATDGIRSGFDQGVIPGDPPQQIADHILAEHGKGTDDALVLVVRYLGYQR